jgi:hypothetical protein
MMRGLLTAAVQTPLALTDAEPPQTLDILVRVEPIAVR